MERKTTTISEGSPESTTNRYAGWRTAASRLVGSTQRKPKRRSKPQRYQGKGLLLRRIGTDVIADMPWWMKNAEKHVDEHKLKANLTMVLKARPIVPPVANLNFIHREIFSAIEQLRKR